MTPGRTNSNDSALRHRKILVTGGCGFIGSALVRHLVGCRDAEVLNIDKLTYAGDRATVAEVERFARYRYERADICDAATIAEAFGRFEPDAVVHLAAESHVDRSIDGPAEFIHTNVLGTFTLLEAALNWYRTRSSDEQERFRFLHVSTDEVYGALSQQDGAFTERSQYQPNSPYAASKASADHLVRAWGRTFGLPVIISNCSNNYGPFQYPEKMIPTLVLCGMHRARMPVYGTGENIRDWLFVEDHVSALEWLLARGRPGETYLVGGGGEMRNIDLARNICAILDDLRPLDGARHEMLIQFVDDRPGHDLRYAVDSSKIRSELGWAPQVSFSTGLRRTIQWYIDHESWCHSRLANRPIGERLGRANATGSRKIGGLA